MGCAWSGILKLVQSIFDTWSTISFRLFLERYGIIRSGWPATSLWWQSQLIHNSLSRYVYHTASVWCGFIARPNVEYAKLLFFIKVNGLKLRKQSLSDSVKCSSSNWQPVLFPTYSIILKAIFILLTMDLTNHVQLPIFVDTTNNHFIDYLAKKLAGVQIKASQCSEKFTSTLYPNCCQHTNFQLQVINSTTIHKALPSFLKVSHMLQL